ncbi:hypothetical protein SBOR_5498 [Sclerotinia borealis F-4128]|uniref:F-box domain-containing protein n=1 Tax=Sclerotinia borealis (strain F-4128) TaxID=1432307 RepID=W9CE34_SCLBF|nr:hypothetical protein SBOR_5498 [Sclerotinia borealis F-4128]
MTGNIFDNLPIELLVQIVSNLDREDLRNVRYADRRITNAAKKTFFNTVFICSSGMSLTKLSLISKDENIRGLVRSVFYHRRFPSQIPVPGALVRNAGSKSALLMELNVWLEMLPESFADPNFEGYSTQMLEQLYERMYDHMSRQDPVLGSDHEKNWLRRGLESLHNLSSLQIGDVYRRDYPVDISRYRERKLISILYGRAGLPGMVQPDIHLHGLLTMVSRLPLNLTRISLPIYFQAWYIKWDTTPLSMFRNVEEFDAKIIRERDASQDPTLEIVRQVWDSMPKLKKLSISFLGHVGWHGMGRPSTFGLIMKHHHWKHLQAVHFHDLVALPVEFKDFLRVHSSTLRGLHLSGYTYFSDVFLGIHDLSEDSESEKRSKFAWIDLIIFLGLEMNLNNLSLEGDFTTCGNETWTTDYKTWDWVTPPIVPDPSRPSLITRIHDFVVHRGECPFRRRFPISQEFKNWHPFSEWEYDADRSWCFQKNDPLTFQNSDDPDYRELVELS